jgi:CheY-like chemotaxis protein
VSLSPSPPSLGPPKRKILIVDDEEDALETIGMCLMDLGFSFETYTDPVNALLRFLEYPDMFPIVISDVRMPKIDGVEFAKKVLKARSSVYVILMTALEVKEDVEKRLREIRVNQVLKKPFNMGDLYRLISSSDAIPLSL